MDMLLTVLTPLIVAIIGFSVFTLMRREREYKADKLNRCDFVIRSSMAWGVIMLVIDAFLLSLLIVGNLEKSMGFFNIIIIALFLVFAYGALAVFRDNVRVNGEKIIYTPPIGKRKTYLFSQIEKVDVCRGCIVVYVNSKSVFTIEPNAVGAKLFCELVREKLSKQDNE